MNMSVISSTSNPYIKAIQSEWEKTPEGSWQKLKVEVSDKGDIKVQQIAHGAFLHFLSSFVQCVTFGLIKDAFSRKIVLISIHVNPSDKSNFLEDESRKIAQCVKENKTFAAIYSAISVHLAEFPNVKRDVDGPEPLQLKKIPAEVIQWREAKLQDIREHLVGSEKNRNSSLIDRFENLDMLFGLESAFESRKNAWQTLQRKIRAVTDSATFGDIESEILTTKNYDLYFLESLSSIQYPHEWLENLRHSLSSESQKFFSGPIGSKTIEELDAHFQHIAKDHGHALTLNILKEAATIIAELGKEAEDAWTTHRKNTIRFTEGKLSNFIAAFYDRLKPTYNPKAPLDELISSAKSLNNLMIARLPGSKRPNVEGLAEVEAMAKASLKLNYIVKYIEKHLKMYGDTHYLSSAKLATMLSDLVDESKKVDSFEALDKYAKKVMQTKDQLEKNLIFAQFVMGMDLPTQLLKVKEEKLRMLHDKYRLGNFEVMHTDLKAQRSEWDEKRKGFQSKGWFTTSIVPLKQLTENQLEEYQTQIMDAIVKATDNRGADGILSTVYLHTGLQNILGHAQGIIEKEAPANLKQVVSEQTQELAKQAENIPTTVKTLQSFALSMEKVALTILDACKKHAEEHLELPQNEDVKALQTTEI